MSSFKFLLMVVVSVVFVFASCDEKVEYKDLIENCANGEDDDGDGFIDCDDQDCFEDPMCTQETCTDGDDNDGDGLVDCADSEDCTRDGSPLSDQELKEAGDLLSLGCGIYSKACAGVGNECFIAEDITVTCPSSDGMGKCADDLICVCIGESSIPGNEICNDGLDNDDDDLVDCVDLNCVNLDCAEEGDCGECIVGAECAGIGTMCSMGTRDGTALTCPTTDGSSLAGICSEADLCVCPTFLQADEICDNGLDDDEDGFIDCLDIDDCEEDPSCQAGVENCADEVDNDDDGFIDCDDQDCFGNPVCTPEICNNEIDDDGDGDVDCADLECSDSSYCQSLDPEICDNGIDDDLDGDADCADADCAESSHCQSVDPEECTDGVDNDLDGLIDCDDVDDCNGHANCVIPSEDCTNNVDDDGDGDIDCNDSDCIGHANCAGGVEVCDNHLDDDNDGFAGCVDAECEGDAACTGYTFMCISSAIPGDICGPGAGHSCAVNAGVCAEYKTINGVNYDCVCP